MNTTSRKEARDRGKGVEKKLDQARCLMCTQKKCTILDTNKCGKL